MEKGKPLGSGKGWLAARGNVANIFKTMTNHPKLLRRWLVFASRILSRSTLDARAA